MRLNLAIIKREITKKKGNKMKKVLFTALLALGLVASFTGCEKKEAPVEAPVEAPAPAPVEAPAPAPVETPAPAADAAATPAPDAAATPAPDAAATPAK